VSTRVGQGTIGLQKQTKTAHPPEIDQPIVWGVQLMPFSSKKAVCSRAAVFSDGHSGRGMWKDGRKGVGIVRAGCWTRALDSAGFDERPLFGLRVLQRAVLSGAASRRRICRRWNAAPGTQTKRDFDNGPSRMLHRC
jgi:hypothetical protein